MLHWRAIYLATVGLRFVLALSDSYVHPDEHFQSFEVLANRIFGYSTNLPWEFTSEAPARSLAPLYFVYGPIMYLVKYFDLSFLPLQLLYLVRLEFLIISWLVIDHCIYQMMPTKPERIKGIFFTLTCYISLVYQSHTFSNSIETVLLLLLVMYSEDMRVEIAQEKIRPSQLQFFKFGLVFAFGVFNRVTFLCFALVPGLFAFQYVFTSRKLSLLFIAAFAGFITSTACVFIDTYGYSKLSSDEFWTQLKTNPRDIEWIFTPLNNILYNSKHENLSTHGIHPRYTHFLVNLPQLFGPSGLFFLYYKGNKYWRTTPFLTAFVGMLLLSLVPHQELRFLVPIVPLLCCCFDLLKFQTKRVEVDKIKQEVKKPEKKGKKTKKKNKKGNQVEDKKALKEDQPNEDFQTPTTVKVLMAGWYIFNILLSFLMGVMHQGGVIPALDHLHSEEFEGKTVFIWWRTYSPPTWMLADQEIQIVVSTDQTEVAIPKVSKSLIIDTMGSKYLYVETLLKAMKRDQSKVLLVAPVGSFATEVEHKGEFLEVWNYKWHLDMDHLDFGDMKSLQPGLSVYEFL